MRSPRRSLRRRTSPSRAAGRRPGLPSGSDPWTIVSFLSSTRARALIASMVVFTLGTNALTRPPRMNGTSASVCLTSSIRCGVSHGPFVSVSSARRAAHRERLAVEARRDAHAGASAWHVVGASRPAAVLRRRVPDRVVGGACDRRVGREAVAEVRAAREGRRVHLHLQVSLVDVPVADVDHEQEEEEEGRRQHGEQHGDPAALVPNECPDRAHEHCPLSEGSAGRSSRIVDSARIVNVELPTNGIHL